jgi:hypothetical protein
MESNRTPFPILAALHQATREAVKINGISYPLDP